MNENPTGPEITQEFLEVWAVIRKLTEAIEELCLNCPSYARKVLDSIQIPSSER